MIGQGNIEVSKNKMVSKKIGTVNFELLYQNSLCLLGLFLQIINS